MWISVVPRCSPLSLPIGEKQKENHYKLKIRFLFNKLRRLKIAFFTGPVVIFKSNETCYFIPFKISEHDVSQVNIHKSRVDNDVELFIGYYPKTVSIFECLGIDQIVYNPQLISVMLSEVWKVHWNAGQVWFAYLTLTVLVLSNGV